MLELTAREAAARVELWITGTTPTTRHDTLRRRVQELEENHGLLRIVSDNGDATVYGITPPGLEVRRRLSKGEKPDIYFRPEALARLRDRDPSHKATRKLRPKTDFHRILYVFEKEGL